MNRKKLHSIWMRIGGVKNDRNPSLELSLCYLFTNSFLPGKLDTTCVWLGVGFPKQAPPAEQGRVGVFPRQGQQKFYGCVGLQICENSAVFSTLLHRQVLDLLDWPHGQMKF